MDSASYHTTRAGALRTVGAGYPEKLGSTSPRVMRAASQTANAVLPVAGCPTIEVNAPFGTRGYQSHSGGGVVKVGNAHKPLRFVPRLPVQRGRHEFVERVLMISRPEILALHGLNPSFARRDLPAQAQYVNGIAGRITTAVHVETPCFPGRGQLKFVGVVSKAGGGGCRPFVQLGSGGIKIGVDFAAGIL